MIQMNLRLPRWLLTALADTTSEQIHITKGYGAGGTYGGVIWHLDRALFKNKHCKLSWVTAPIFSQLEDPLLTTFIDVLANKYQLYEDIHYTVRWSKTPDLTFHHSKHQIQFISAQRPERLTASNVSHSLSTEPGLYKAQVFQRLNSRVRHVQATACQQFYEGTPEGLTEWEKIANFTEGVNGKKRRLIVPTKANLKNLRDGYLESLIESFHGDENMIAAYTEGLFRNFNRGTAYWNWKSKYLDPLVKPSPFHTIHLCWDFNIAPLANVVFQSVPQEKHGFRRMTYPIVWNGSGLARGLINAIAEFIDAFPPEIYGNTLIEVHGDASGHGGDYRSPGSDYDVIMNALKERYRNVILKTPRSNPKVRTRLERINSLFAYDRVLVSPECKNTIIGFEKTALKPGTYDIVKPGKDDWTHFPDAVSYGLYEVTQHENLETPSERRKLFQGKN